MDHGRFPGVHEEKQPWRRKRRSDCEDSLQNPAIPWGTGAVLPRIFGFSREYIPCFFVLQLAYGSLQSTYSSPDQAMAGDGRSRRRSVGKAFGAMWPPGLMSTRGLAAAAGAGAFGVRCVLAGTLPGPSCGFLASRKREGTNKAMPGGATPGTTLTRPLVSAVVQMCPTFQKSSVN